MEQLQRFFHRNISHSAGSINGPSTHNPWIEFFSGILSKECSQFWIKVFNHIRDDGYFTGDKQSDAIILCEVDPGERDVSFLPGSKQVTELKHNVF